MRCKNNHLALLNLFLFSLVSLPSIRCAAVKDIFNLNAPLSTRVPRDNKYYPNQGRYGSSVTLRDRDRDSGGAPSSRVPIKPEESQEAHEATPIPVEKRCTRCGDSQDSRYPYDSRSRYYDDRRYRDRDRYDLDDRRYDRYDDRRYDRYDRYDDRDSRYYERSRYDRPDYYDRDNRYDRDYNRNDRDGYGRDKYYDRYDRYDRYSDKGVGYDNRGVGYDNRGYDDRQRYDRDGYRPWDETYRGTSGFDNSGRGYYFATGRPEVGASGGWTGSGGYASGWNYGSQRDDRDRYYTGNGYRSRDPYDGYRSTSYLYGRPSSTTTDNPNINTGDGDSGGVTKTPILGNTSG